MNRFPKGVATGNPPIDALLRSLDRKLVGTPAVRRLTLIEVRDHLLEASTRHEAAGATADHAGRKAANEFGNGDEIAAEQRQQRAALFRALAPRFGLMYASGMAAFHWLSGTVLAEGWLHLLVGFIAHFLTFGAFMGFFIAYMFAQATPEPTADGDGSTFEVQSPRSSKIAAIAVGLVLLTIAGFALAGLIGTGPWNRVGAGSNLFVILAALPSITMFRGTFARISVTHDELIYRGLLQSARIPWDRIRRVTRPKKNFMRFCTGVPYRVEWSDRETPGASPRFLTLVFNGEMVNADRLIAQLQEHANTAWIDARSTEAGN